VRLSCGPSVKGKRRITKVSGRQVLVPQRHPRITMTENRHDRPLRHASHRETARGVVSEVMERQILDTE
jgi:hypothetical protein